ncbi:hypothetical protein LX59_01108 [Azomonas agilis]|uniref:Uncharacterized protein n=1 Tax=Azomonas agilis TaxID=116849 RepID=A0A562IZ35_9GAMM|nr:hypothetical protein LX59_01108 [Azomonas agilis]
MDCLPLALPRISSFDLHRTFALTVSPASVIRFSIFGSARRAVAILVTPPLCPMGGTDLPDNTVFAPP